MPDDFRLDDDLAERLLAIDEDPESFENRERGWRHGHEYVSKYIDDKVCLASSIADGLPRVREFAASQRHKHPAKPDAALTDEELEVKRIVRGLLGLPDADLNDAGLEVKRFLQETFERNSSRLTCVNFLVVPFAAIQAAEAYRDTLSPNCVVLTASEYQQWLEICPDSIDDDDWFVVHSYDVDTSGKRREEGAFWFDEKLAPNETLWIASDDYHGGRMWLGGNRTFWGWDGERARRVGKYVLPMMSY